MIEESSFTNENEWKARETDQQFNGVFARTIINRSQYFNIISVPLLYLCKTNYLSGNK